MTIRTVAFRIIEADIKKRNLLRKMEEVVDFDEGLKDDSLTYLVWDMLDLLKQKVNHIDGYKIYEYDWEETLTEMYYGKDGVIEGGIEINDYLDTIIEMADGIYENN